MIKFFRKIRYDLMGKNKTEKYLKYAIGEIVLVVIGILVALSINNWNENRKSDIELNNYLELMTEELQQDKLFYSKLISETKNKLEYLTSLSNGNYENLNLESSPDIIAWNSSIRNFGSAYYTLKENGDLISINSKRLKDIIVHYYADLTTEFNHFTDWHKNFVTSNIENYTMENLPLDIYGNTKDSLVINEMQNNKLSSIVNFQIDNFKIVIKMATDNTKYSEVLIEELDNEIKKMK
jgi:hypothetical protein